MKMHGCGQPCPQDRQAGLVTLALLLATCLLGLTSSPFALAAETRYHFEAHTRTLPFGADPVVIEGELTLRGRAVADVWYSVTIGDERFESKGQYEGYLLPSYEAGLTEFVFDDLARAKGVRRAIYLRPYCTAGFKSCRLGMTAGTDEVFGRFVPMLRFADTEFQLHEIAR